jgi:hypothetical protein
MGSSKKYCKLKGNSILESVIALTIISICLYVAVMVYASVFSPKTSAGFYSGQHAADELFFLMQVRDDSVSNEMPGTKIEEEWLNTSLKHITVERTDSAGVTTTKNYYITAGHE